MVKYKFIGLILLIIFIGISTISANKEILIIKSNDNIYFDRMTDGINNSFDKSGISNTIIKEYNLLGDIKYAMDVLNDIQANTNVILIVTFGARASELVANRILNIPVIFAGVLNYQRYDLNKDNIYGVSNEIDMKINVSLLKMLNAEISKVGVFSRDFEKKYYEEKKAELKNIGLDLIIYDFPDRTSRLRKSIRDLFNSCDAFYFTSDISLLNEFEYIYRQADKSKIPVLAFSSELVKAGFLASVSVDYYTIGVQIYNIINQILNNRVEKNIHTPLGTFSSLNMQTLNNLELTPPDYALRMIEEIFE